MKLLYESDLPRLSEQIFQGQAEIERSAAPVQEGSCLRSQDRKKAAEKILASENWGIVLLVLLFALVVLHVIFALYYILFVYLNQINFSGCF